jgi:hypothetical protein
MRKITALILLLVTTLSYGQGGYTYPDNQRVYHYKTHTFDSLKVSGGTTGQVLTKQANGFARYQSVSSPGWSLTGNAGTVGLTNFIGTTDNVPFIIKTNNATRATFGSAGEIDLATGGSVVNGTLILDNNGAFNLSANYNAGSVTVYGDTVQGLKFITGAGEVVRVAQDGKVGIGTTTPTYELDLVGSQHLTGGVYFGTGGQNISRGSFDNGTGGDQGISLNCAVGYELNWQGGHLTSNTSGNFIPVAIDSGLTVTGVVTTTLISDTLLNEYSVQSIGGDTFTIAQHSALGFGVGAACTSCSTAASLSVNFNGDVLLNANAGDGNVGIGTASPAYTLDVVGTSVLARIDGDNRYYISNNAGDFPLPIMRGHDVVNGLDAYLAVSEEVIGFNVSDSITGEATFGQINSTGFGIGTTSPTAKLDVAGHAKTQTYTGNGYTYINTDLTAGMLAIGFADTSLSNDNYLRISTAEISLSSGNGSIGQSLTLSNGSVLISGSNNFTMQIGGDPLNTYNQGLQVSSPATDTIPAFDVLANSQSAPHSAFKVLSNGNIGIGNAAPAAVLDVTSTTSGVLLPRVTETQRDGFATPANGMIIYNTTTDKFQGYAAGAWVDLH